MAYFEEDTQLRDILITGGDALMSQNKTLQNILDAVYRMAARKQRANLERKDGEKYAELQRVRLGSRLLAYLPMRINDGLVDVLREFKEKASAIGVKQFIIQTHFQTPLRLLLKLKKRSGRFFLRDGLLRISWYIRWLLHVEGIRPGFVRCSIRWGWYVITLSR